MNVTQKGPVATTITALAALVLALVLVVRGLDSPTPAPTPVSTPTPTFTVLTATVTASPTATATPAILPTATPAPAPTDTPTPTPSPTATPAPAVAVPQAALEAAYVPPAPLAEAPRPLTAAEVRTFGHEVGFPEAELDNLVCIVQHESANDPHAVNHNTNGSTDYGLAQLNSWWAGTGPAASFGPRLDLTRVFDPLYNLSFAFRIWRDGGTGWVAWATASLCGLA